MNSTKRQTAENPFEGTMTAGPAAWLVILLTLLAAGTSSAQPPQSCTVDPDEPGAWSRPFGPFAAMGASDTQLPNDEIAHAIVLPPPAGNASLVRVLFICRVNCGTIYPTETKASAANRSFVWYPANRPAGDRPPTTVEVLNGPSFGYVGTADAFCSGHTVAADGSVIVAGGENWVAKCSSTEPCIVDENKPVGHKRIYKLDTSADPPEWVLSETWPAPMGREHWYPSVITTNDGLLLILGHYWAPSPDCPVPSWDYGSEPATERVYELFNPATTASAVWENTPLLAGGCTQPEPAQSLGLYPRLHLLSEGWLVHPNCFSHSAVPPGPRALLMDFEHPTCVTERRWDDVFINGQTVHRNGGSSVHLVVRDTSMFKGVRDVVIELGGTDEDDDNPCPGVTAGTQEIFDSVELLDPDPNHDLDPSDGVWSALAPMSNRRVDHNTVILPTGSLVVAGGLGGLPSAPTTCTPVLAVEEYFPAAIFGGALANTWHARGTITVPRVYHSVAGLLPDGRAFWAGGNGNGSTHAYHTLQIYSPEYYGNGNRPVITNSWNPATPSAFLNYNADWSVPVNVNTPCSSPTTIARVVLIRSSSSTHAFDMNQRYVELGSSPGPGSQYPNFSLVIHGPFDGYVAPPGYYLLFVIDSNGLPSEGRWVRVAAALP